MPPPCLCPPLFPQQTLRALITQFSKKCDTSSALSCLPLPFLLCCAFPRSSQAFIHLLRPSTATARGNGGAQEVHFPQVRPAAMAEDVVVPDSFLYRVEGEAESHLGSKTLYYSASTPMTVQEITAFALQQCGLTAQGRTGTLSISYKFAPEDARQPFTDHAQFFDGATIFITDVVSLLPGDDAEDLSGIFFHPDVTTAPIGPLQLLEDFVAIKSGTIAEISLEALTRKFDWWRNFSGLNNGCFYRAVYASVLEEVVLAYQSVRLQKSLSAFFPPYFPPPKPSFPTFVLSCC